MKWITSFRESFSPSGAYFAAMLLVPPFDAIKNVRAGQNEQFTLVAPFRGDVEA